MKYNHILIGVVVLLIVGTTAPALAVEPGHNHGSMKMAGEGTVQAEGVIKAIDRKEGKITIDHGPIPELNWPTMAMDFALEDPALIDQVQVGDKVKFKLAPADGGEYRITAIQVVDQ